MKTEFVSYELALKMKQLGFDEPCMAAFEDNGKLFIYWNDLASKDELFCSQKACEKLDYECLVPTWQQAFRWFRENHNLRGFIGFRPNIKQFDCHIYDMSLSGKEYVKQRTMEEFNKDPKVGTYEEAELECLKKLINIVKKK
jgi:hypothetical protein